MAGDKKNKEFSASPFRQLKGFCVSGDREQKGVPAPSAHPLEPVPEPNVDFAAEMVRQGVRRTGAAEVAAAASTREQPVAEPAAPMDDHALFLAAIGEMRTTFADELPAAAEPPGAPRLKKLLQSDRFLPDGELDLHGLDRLRAREKVRFYLENAVYHGRKTALLITGRGHGSAGEPILRSEVENFLMRDAAPWVVEWAPAPRRLGGDGAFVVLLRGKRKE